MNPLLLSLLALAADVPHPDGALRIPIAPPPPDPNATPVTWTVRYGRARRHWYSGNARDRRRQRRAALAADKATR